MKENIFRKTKGEIVKKRYFLLNLMALHDKIQTYRIFPLYPSGSRDKGFGKIKNKNRPKPIIIVGICFDVDRVYIRTMYSARKIKCSGL